MDTPGKDAITIEHVSKTFLLPKEKSSSIKGALINLARGKKGYEKQQVLDDISFEIKKGDFFGIVGRNGSGKSTLLKLLAGIYSPDSGSINVTGKLTPFIELGVGFNPELTGRENVFLNGALLGFSRKEMEALYEDIVDFAEIRRFMDQKLKNYSSGMQVRLAFSIAIQAKTDILLLDEVLAVGDEAFQKKCINVFERYKAESQTIILVTHDMSVVEKYCNKAVLLDSGKIVMSGDPRKVAHQYSRMNQESYIAEQSKAEEKRHKKSLLKTWDVTWEVTDGAGKKRKSFEHGDDVRVAVRWKEPTIKNIGVVLMTQTGEYVFGANTIFDKHQVVDGQVSYNLNLNVGPGTYEFKFGLFGDKETDAIEFIDDGPRVVVTSSDKTWGGVTKLAHSWQ